MEPTTGTGTWLHNPATGELARVLVTAEETDGRRVESELLLQPGAGVPGAHVHDPLEERFEVLAGEVALRVGEREQVLRPGDGAVEVPAGVVHDWWNAGTGSARVHVVVRAAPGASGRPAARFSSAVEVMWSLAALGRVDARGRPDPLWLAAVAREYRDVIRFVSPPALVQLAVLAPLAALARRRGRDPLAPHLHGPAAPCVVPAPSEAELAALLARPVLVRAPA